VVIILIVPICGYCSNYEEDDFPELFGKCKFKPDCYVAFHAVGCKKWEINLKLEILKCIIDAAHL
jgi:hypothetical protein